MTPEDLDHLPDVGRTTGSGAYYFSSLTEVGGAHNRRAYGDKLFRILAAEVIEAVHRASLYAERLAWTDGDGFAINRPGHDTFNAVENLLVSIVLVGRRRHLLPRGDEKFEHGYAAIRVMAREKEPDP